MTALLLGDATSAEADGTELLLVPLGAVEQHGPHLPLGTDGLIAQAACGGVAATLREQGRCVAVAPVVELGASGEHEGFAGTVSIGHEALRHVLVELVRSATRWCPRVVLVSGHGGNVPALSAACRLLREESRDVAWTTCAEPGWDAHAGLAETSIVLALAPDLVRAGRAEPGNTEPVQVLWPRLRSAGVAAVAPNGVLGDPTGATAEHGQELLTVLVERIVRQVRSGAVGDAGVLLRPDGAGTEATP